jgi:plasmid stability protein
MKSCKGMKRITIDLADNIYRELKIRCASEDISMADVVRKLLENYLKSGKKKK